MSAYQQLTQQFIRIDRFNHLSAMAGWDQATMMPSGGNQARSEALAEVRLHIHHLQIDVRIGEWLKQTDSENLSAEQLASVREMRRQYQQATLLPAKLVEAKSLAGSKCEHGWRTQKPNHDWAGFSQNFAEVVKLSQQEAQIRANALGCSPYDAMLDIYEPGVTTAQLDSLFDEVKAWLPELITQVQNKQSQEQITLTEHYYTEHAQYELGLKVMKVLGFDFEHGRLDTSLHPFCGGVPDDVRITTRYDEADFVQSLMGIIHETGHARYEQGLPKKFAGLPVGQARSMGIHESQSLFFEMQLGRSRTFVEFLAPLAAEAFGINDVQRVTADNLYQLYTRVQPGFIRVDADEVTYPMHVILRYEIERDLVNGVISYQDIPELWQAKMQDYLGLDVNGQHALGCMQDIHWTDGSFGYFPSYTLGAMYAAQFMATMRQQVDVDQALATQQLTPIFSWLEKQIWQKGSLLNTEDLILDACGEPLSADYLKIHLKQRYLA